MTRLEEAEGLLRDLEWKGGNDDVTGNPTCPECRGLEFGKDDVGHHSLCRLSAVLARSTSSPPAPHNFADCIKADGDKPCKDCVEYALESVGAPVDPVEAVLAVECPRHKTNDPNSCHGVIGRGCVDSSFRSSSACYPEPMFCMQRIRRALTHYTATSEPPTKGPNQ